MIRKSLSLLAALGVLGCGVEHSPVSSQGDDLGTTEDSAELSASSRTYVTLRRDFRKCLAPMCGGYFVGDVNRANPSEKYVNSLDFSKSNLSAEDIAVVLEAPEAELVLRGKLGPTEARFNTRSFLVYEAYRGMPGVEVSDSTFYTVADSEIRCVRAPCFSLTAKKLNGSATRGATGVSVARASKPLVDENWLSIAVMRTEAIVAAKFTEVPVSMGGKEVLIDASQVFLRVPQEQSCPQVKVAACPDDTERTWYRDDRRCILPASCRGKSPDCPRASSTACAAGYTRIKWATEPEACTQTVCDPSWLFSGH
ncbi:MAG: hypothetical protein K1X64_23040 [Myxococcaceae bacterium]|nr:hypothetical protein [Myxococcaceae bacterium]